MIKSLSGPLGILTFGTRPLRGGSASSPLQRYHMGRSLVLFPAASPSEVAATSSINCEDTATWFQMPRWGPRHQRAETSHPCYALSKFLTHRCHEHNTLPNGVDCPQKVLDQLVNWSFLFLHCTKKIRKLWDFVFSFLYPQNTFPALRGSGCR